MMLVLNIMARCDTSESLVPILRDSKHRIVLAGEGDNGT